MTREEIEKILATEFSPEFVELMKNRMVMSYYKYGLLTDAYPHRVDAIGSLIKRLEKYRDTGNTEWLVDAANFAMIEFMHPRHENAHFAATDSDASPGRRTKSGLMDDRSNSEVGTNRNSRTAQFRDRG